jgi:acetoin utilization deacetylase AcuC-like enzyme
MTPVFYDPRQNVTGLDSYSPSAGKPARLVELLQHFAFHAYGPQKLGRVDPVTQDDLKLVHTADYVDNVFALREQNGHGNFDPRVPESCLWTIGSLLSAARHAIQYPELPVCSPTSGFHHAGHDFGGGFCTFNGLMVVAAKLISESPVMKIAILDCDMHTGNGTQDILKKMPGLAGNVLHITQGAKFYGDNPVRESIEFKFWLSDAINDVNAFSPDLVLYQAGADPHVNDPLGGFLTTAQLAERDAIVFKHIRAPIAWNLAGGYQAGNDIFDDPVLQIHHNTIREADKSVALRSLKAMP